MPWRLALDVYDSYYMSLVEHMDILKRYLNRFQPNQDYKEYLLSFFSELEKSNFPDWIKVEFVKQSVEISPHFYQNWYANYDIMARDVDKFEKWLTEQRNSYKEFIKIKSLAEERVKKKTEGIVFLDEKKYKKPVEIIMEKGSTFGHYLSRENTWALTNICINYVTKKRECNDDTTKEKIRKIDVFNNYLNDPLIIERKEKIKKEEEIRNKIEETLGISYQTYIGLSLENRQRLIGETTGKMVYLGYDLYRDGTPEEAQEKYLEMIQSTKQYQREQKILKLKRKLNSFLKK